jgi:hypothetical protein
MGGLVADASIPYFYSDGKGWIKIVMFFFGAVTATGQKISSCILREDS